MLTALNYQPPPVRAQGNQTKQWLINTVRRRPKRYAMELRRNITPRSIFDNTNWDIRGKVRSSVKNCTRKSHSQDAAYSHAPPSLPLDVDLMRQPRRGKLLILRRWVSKTRALNPEFARKIELGLRFARSIIYMYVCSRLQSMHAGIYLSTLEMRICTYVCRPCGKRVLDLT